MRSAIPHSGRLKAALLAVASLTVMASAIISPALPAMDQHFARHSDLMVKLILTMPALSIVLFGPVMGYVVDRFPRRRLLLCALLVYALAGASGFVLDSLPLLLFSRAVLGVAVSAIMAVGMSLTGDYFRADERARFLGVQGSFMSLGGVLFVNLGGLLAMWSWRGPFLVYLFALVVIPLVLWQLFEPEREQAPAGTAATGGAGLDYGRTALVYGMALLGLLLFYMVPTQLPFLLVERGAGSGPALGLAVSVATMSSAFASFFYGRVRGHLGYVQIYILALSLAALGYTGVGLVGSYGLTVASIALAGLGFGLMLPNGNLWLMSLAPPAIRGRVIGGLTSMIFLGQFLSPLAMAPITLRWGLAAGFLSGAGLVAVTALALYLWLRGQTRSAQGR